jgi:YD repeat-containing protein
VHLPSTITEPTRTTNIAYDTSGNVHTSTVTDTTVTPNVSRTWTYTYNGTGEMLTAQDPRSNTTTMTYSSGNLATVVDALNHTTNFTSYDADGRLKGLTDPNGLPTAFTYDLHGNRLTQSVGSTATSGGTQITTLVRDAAENITQVTKPDGSALTYTRDAANRVTESLDPSKRLVAAI